MTNKELCKKFNITEPTFYNWRKTKPELLKLILQYKSFCNLNTQDIQALTIQIASLNDDNKKLAIKYIQKLQDIQNFKG